MFAGLLASAAVAAVVLDGKVEPPFEYVLHLTESRREAGKDGLDALVSVSRSADGYHIALRFPTTLTAEDLEAVGGFGVSVFTAAGEPAARTPILRVASDTAMGRTVEGAAGVKAMRRLDTTLGVLVVEIVLAPGSYGATEDGSPLLRIEIDNGNVAHGNPNVGRQTFPARAEDGDALGLARFPADPRRAAANSAMDDLDSHIAGAMGDADALAVLADLAEAARMALSMPDDGGSVKDELAELLGRLEQYADQQRIDSADVRAIRIAAETVLRLTGE